MNKQRAELHLHTTMSVMDGVSTVTDYIKAATETSSQTSPILSSFIPENHFISSTNQITVKKNTPYLISTVKKYGIIVTFKSSKNISLAFIYLPIYIEDI